MPRAAFPVELKRLADADALRDAAKDAFVTPLAIDLDQLREQPAGRSRSPQDAAARSGQRDWDAGWPRPRRGAAEGRSQRQRHAAQFATAVLAAEPDCDRRAGHRFESGDTVSAPSSMPASGAAGDRVLLWIALRRIGDVLLTLVPLLLAGAVTLEICVLIGHAAELRQHHRAAAAARRRRRVQDLLRHGVAGRARPTCCSRA